MTPHLNIPDAGLVNLNLAAQSQAWADFVAGYISSQLMHAQSSGVSCATLNLAFLGATPGTPAYNWLYNEVRRAGYGVTTTRDQMTLSW